MLSSTPRRFLINALMDVLLVHFIGLD